MKQIIATFILALTLTFTLPTKDSEAGLVVGFATGSTAAGLGAAVAGGATVIMLRKKKMERFGSSLGDSVNKMFFEMGTVFLTPFVGVVLDVEANLPADTIVETLRKSLPFIDNMETFEGIAFRVKEKLKQLEVNSETTELSINFNRNEVSELLSATDLSDDQFEEVVQALE